MQQDVDAYQLLADQVRSLAMGAPGWVPALANVAALLGERLDDVNWVGFYVATPNDTLVLGPFWGHIACVTIPFGKGVCGTAAAERRSVLVPDVRAFPGHIACDAASRSELVVPLFVPTADGTRRVWGVLDCDSPHPTRFSAEDQEGFGLIARAVEESAGLAGPAVRATQPWT